MQLDVLKVLSHQINYDKSTFKIDSLLLRNNDHLLSLYWKLTKKVVGKALLSQKYISVKHPTFQNVSMVTTSFGEDYVQFKRSRYA